MNESRKYLEKKKPDTEDLLASVWFHLYKILGSHNKYKVTADLRLPGWVVVGGSTVNRSTETCGAIAMSSYFDDGHGCICQNPLNYTLKMGSFYSVQIISQ